MTTATGEFPVIAVSDADVQVPKRRGRARGVRQMLTVETKPLIFGLTFSNGERLRLEMTGCGQEPPGLWQLIAALQRLARLAPSWDSYGALPLNPGAVRRIFGFLDMLLFDVPLAPTVVPARDGGLQLEWHRSDIDLEIKVPPVGPISHLLSDARTDLEREWQGPFDRHAVSEALTKIAQRE